VITKLSGIAVATVIVLSLAGAARGCDLDAHERYPPWDILETKAIPLGMPDLFFKDPGAQSGSCEPADDPTRRDALARGIASFPPEERPILMLVAISGWTRGKDPLTGFFVLSPGAHYDEVVETLDGSGLSEYAALFRGVRAPFGLC
jgi:hypothetical protein